MSNDISAKTISFNSVTISNHSNYNFNNDAFNVPKIDGFSNVITETVNIDFSNNVIIDDLKNYAQNDTQINTSNNFNNYSDFQNITFSNFSFLELFYTDDLSSLSGKTINELFLESSNNGYGMDDYNSFSINDDVLMSLWQSSEKDKYKNLFLGKLISYGFGDLNIVEVINGEDEFDALVLEDGEGNYMIHYSCTDLYELYDLLFDAKPILDELGLNSDFSLLGINPKEKYDSQKQQALNILNKYLNNKEGKKVSISGYSLGGALAEYAYFSYYNSNNNLDSLLMYNPATYQIDTDMNLFKDAYENGRIKRYASEGDLASSIYGGEKYQEFTTSVYIGYDKIISEGHNRTNSSNNILNIWVNNFIDKKIDDIISRINNLKNDGIIIDNIVLNKFIDLLNNLKNKDLNIKDSIDSIYNWCKDNKDFVNLMSIKTGIDIDYEFLGRLKDFPTVLTGIHLPYSIENNKNISFDSNGNALGVIPSLNNYEVKKPSYEEICLKVFGYNITEEVKNNIYKIKNASEEELVEYYFGDMYNLLKLEGYNYKDIEKRVFVDFISKQINSFSSSFLNNTYSVFNNISTYITGYNIDEINSDIKDITYNIGNNVYDSLNNISQSVIGLNLDNVIGEVKSIMFSLKII